MYDYTTIQELFLNLHKNNQKSLLKYAKLLMKEQNNKRP